MDELSKSVEFLHIENLESPSKSQEENKKQEDNLEKNSTVANSVKQLKTVIDSIVNLYLDPSLDFLKLKNSVKSPSNLKSEEIEEILSTKTNLFEEASKNITVILTFIRDKITNYNLEEENEEYLNEIVGYVLDFLMVTESNNIQIKDVAEINMEVWGFLCYLLNELSMIKSEMLPIKYKLPWLIHDLVIKFIRNKRAQEIIFDEIVKKLESIFKVSVIDKKFFWKMSGMQIECFFHYMVILKKILEKRFFTSGEKSKNSFDEHKPLKKILLELKPYVSKSLRYLFDECLMYLVNFE